MNILTPTHGQYSLLNRTLESLLKCQLREVLVKFQIVENRSKYAAEKTLKLYEEQV